MAGWRKIAETIRQGGEVQHNSNNRHVSPAMGPNVPIVPNVPADPARLVREWNASIARVRLVSSGSIEGQHWRQLVEDAGWVLAHFADQAARDGWSAADLFGLFPDKPGWGGVADRLRGSRSLVMTAERACWRRISCDLSEQYNQGSYPHLKPLWETE